MQFQLPQELQIELLDYDPKLKALARKQEPAKKSNKSKYPLGNPNDLIPADIVRPAVLQQAIDVINSKPAAERVQSFLKIVNIASSTTETVPFAVIYHFEQCWYAAWLPPKGKEDEYIYGYAYAYKDNAAAHKVIPHYVKQERDKCELIKYGRVEFYVRRDVVTKQDVINSDNSRNWFLWNIPGVYRYHQKSRNISQELSNFEKVVSDSVPKWKDSRGIWDRMRCNSIGKLLIPDVIKLITEQPDEWQVSFESLLQLIDAKSDNAMSYRLMEYSSYTKIKHIINTPFMRRWIQEQCNQCIEKFNDSNVETMAEIKRPWLNIKYYLSMIYKIHEMWPDCPIDYYQTNIGTLLGVSIQTGHTATHEWLRKHMPVASFFTMLNKFYTDEMERVENRKSAGYPSYEYNNSLGCYHFNFNLFNDTVSMLNNILEHKELAPPKRWRINEFHDYVQGEAWKIRNPNQALPQDLFPAPVKVQLDNENWSFFQPIDTHQLASWGQAVRNCVGSATHYADDCRKKKHFIVLCMIDNKPTFTIQLTVDMGLMSVKQIAGIANERLNSEQQTQYTKAFGMALQSRQTQLKSA